MQFKNTIKTRFDHFRKQYQTKDVTPYIHALHAHVPEILKLYKTLLIIPSKEWKSIMTGHPRKRKKSTLTGHPRTKYLEVFVNKPFRWARLPFCSFRHFEMDTTAHVN